MKLSALPFHAALLLLVVGCSTPGVRAQNNNQDANLQAEITNKALNRNGLRNIHVTVQDGVATLTGTVDVYDFKEEADKRVHRTKGIRYVRNEVEVEGPDLPDALLEQKLVQAISTDRVGYGTTAFNAISVNVDQGKVTLAGHAYGPVDADPAVAVAANTRGVKDVVNEIQVDPVSPMDDRIRIAVFRSVYGFPTLNKYSVDPAKPIRISVQNGNVTLYGVVDNKADRDVANIRANGVSGVLEVTNNLMVAGSEAK